MENKIKYLEEQLLNDTDMTDEEYQKCLIDYCNEIDKEPDIDITDEFFETLKRVGLRH